MQISGTHHVAIMTGNLDALRRFYVDVLGLPIVGRIKRTDINILFVGAGNTAIEIVERRTIDTAGRNGGGWDHIALEVADIDATVAELQQQGIAFHVQPRDFPAERPLFRLAFCKDPDGNDVEFVQPFGSRYTIEED
jgi:catechol 2,3-dioxygenase-like lactoylglutathione lyase family enzyme